MNLLDKWADRIYSETDVSRSIATSIGGIVGLGTYLATSDWVIAAFSFLVAFPIVRLLAASRHERLKTASDQQQRHEQADAVYASLSEDEKAIVDAFVAGGGCVMTWTRFNRINLSSSAIESLIERELLNTSVTADGMTETFVLDVSIFDAGIRKLRKEETHSETPQMTGDDQD